eukprot:UN02851
MDEVITSHQQLKPGQTYTIIYINPEAKKTQHILRHKKLNLMRRKRSKTNLPFSRRKSALTSRKSWLDLLSKSSQLIAPLSH